MADDILHLESKYIGYKKDVSIAESYAQELVILSHEQEGYRVEYYVEKVQELYMTFDTFITAKAYASLIAFLVEETHFSLGHLKYYNVLENIYGTYHNEEIAGVFYHYIWFTIEESICSPEVNEKMLYKLIDISKEFPSVYSMPEGLVLIKNKYDVEEAQKLQHGLEVPFFNIPNILSWTQDNNWPVGKIVLNWMVNSLTTNNLEEHIKNILLNSVDNEWKYTIVQEFIVNGIDISEHNHVREAVIQLTRSIEGMPEEVYLYESLKELLPNT